MKGVVKWFNNRKGYGFIIIDGKEAFVHYSQIMTDGYRTLSESEEVVVQNLIKTNKGYQAQAVSKLSI